MAATDPIYDDDESEKPIARPNLRALEGGGETTKPKRGHLSVVGDEGKDEEEEKKLEPDQLKQAESAPDSSIDTSPNKFNYNPNDKGTRVERIRNVLLALATRRNVAIGGGITTVIILLIIGFVGLGSYELVHVRENLLGHNGNALQNFTLRNRRVRSFERILTKAAKGDAIEYEKALDAPKLAQKLADNGFELTTDEAGKITKIAYGNKAADLTTGDVKTSLKNFFEGADSEEVKLAFDKALPSATSTWRGKIMDSFYKRIGTTLGDWVDAARAKMKPNESPTQEADDIAKASESVESEALSKEGMASAEELAKNQKPTEPAQNLETPPGVTDPTDPAQIATSGADTSAVSAAADDIATQADGKNISSLADYLKRFGPSILEEQGAGTMLKTGLKGGLGSVDWALIAQTTCKAKGLVTFLANVRNVMLAIELSRFAIRYMTAADHNKAGILTGEGMKVFMLYMHRPDKSGKTYLSSGGMQRLLGSPDAPIESSDAARYSTARGSTGFFALVDNFISNIPLAGLINRSCSLSNNGFVHLGVGAVGALVAVFGGAESGFTEGIGVYGVGAAILTQITIDLAAPFLSQVFVHEVMTHALGASLGNGLASGWGSTKALEGGYNGLRPSTKAEVSEISKQETIAYNEDLKQQSTFERYFALSNTDSLVSRLALTTVTNNSYSIFSSILSSPIRLLSNASMFALKFTPAYAASTANNDCNNDKYINDLGMATDGFCNLETTTAPQLDIDTTKQILLTHTATAYVKSEGKCSPQTIPAPLITADGKPVSYPNGDSSCSSPGVHMNDDLQDYIDYCHNGRSGILYSEKALMKMDGSNSRFDPAVLKEHDPNTDYEEPCVKPGDPLSNETEGVGRFLRYGTWYGYMLDTQNLGDQINE